MKKLIDMQHQRVIHNNFVLEVQDRQAYSLMLVTETYWKEAWPKCSSGGGGG